MHVVDFAVSETGLRQLNGGLIIPSSSATMQSLLACAAELRKDSKPLYTIGTSSGC